MILSPHLVTLIVGIYLKEILQKKEQEMCAQILLARLSSLGENCKQSKCQQRGIAQGVPDYYTIKKNYYPNSVTM